MALTLGDNFSYQGAKPLDARLKYETVAAMKAVADATMYDGCLAYCSGTDKTYQWKSGNTVDETTGKWREFNSGGGGGGGETYTAGDGIDISAENEISTEKSEAGWMDEVIEKVPMSGPLVNIANAFNHADLYSETEKIVGQWIDGKPLYQKTVIDTLPTTTTDGVVANKFIPLNASIDTVVDVESIFVTNNQAYSETGYIDSTSNVFVYIRAIVLNEAAGGVNKNSLRLATTSSASAGIPARITVRYTKTTDSAIAIGSENEYSTDEKIIGSWVDGRPVYQKVFQPSATISIGTSWTNLHDVSSLNIDLVTKADIHTYPNAGNQDIEVEVYKPTGYIRAKAPSSINYYDNGFLILQYIKLT